jgi:hypothetical protein
LHNALVILLTEILAMTKRNNWLITSHLSHHWIFSLTSNIMTFLVYIEYQNFTRIHIEKIIIQVLILFQENILTALKEGIQSYWDKFYSRGSFNHMWILNYWIFCINLIIVLFQKCSMSKHVNFPHITNHASWECIKTLKHIINNAVIFKMVRNVTNV